MQQEKAGTIPPKLERESAQRSLSEHLQDFMATREKSGVCSKYAKGQHKQLIRLFSECRWKTVADVQRDSFESWRNQTDAHPKTLNEYLGTANVFLKWMEGCGRIPSNPLSKVPTVETRGRDKRKRRAFTQAEIGRLLDVSGPRAVVVLLALYTGLRRGELGSLLWGDVHLDGSGTVLECPRLHNQEQEDRDHSAAPMPGAGIARPPAGRRRFSPEGLEGTHPQDAPI